MSAFKTITQLILIGLLALPALAQAEPPASFTDLSYPAYGNLKQREGSIVVWFRDEEPKTLPGVKTWAEPRKRFSRYIMFVLKPNDDHRVLIFNRHFRDNEMGLHSSITLPGGVSNIGDKPRKSIRWQEGDIHWIAYTWDKDGNHRLYADGDLIGTRVTPRPELGIGPISPDGSIEIGGPDSAISVLGVLTLLDPLDEETMRNTGPDELFQLSESTLLLDRMENVDMQKRLTQPERISSYSGPMGGTFGSAAKLVEINGQPALQLYSK